jgi:hypothetical protein
MLWRRILPFATAQQFIVHTSQSLDPKSITLFSLKEACSNKNMFVCLTYSEKEFVFPKQNHALFVTWTKSTVQVL